MPPIGKLPQEKIDALTKWIEIGLPFPKEDEIEPKNVHSHASTTEVNEVTKSHWAYKKPPLPIIPDLPDHANPIDRFIHAGDDMLATLWAVAGEIGMVER